MESKSAYFLRIIFAVIAFVAAPGFVSAATNIYYSVGQNTSDHKTGSPTVTISGTTATFSVAQTASNMGIGDIVNFGGERVFITGKTSTTVWSVSTATGGTPTATTSAPVTSITHAFSSLRNAVGNGVSGNATSTNFLNTSDLVSGDYILNIPLYYDSGADTTAVNISGITTGASNYIRVFTATSTATQVNQNQRHSGSWNTSKYRLDLAGQCITSSVNFLRIDGIQCRMTSTGSLALAFDITPSNSGVIEISNNIIRGTLSGSAVNNAAIRFRGSDGTTKTAKIWNNIIYGFTNGSNTNHGMYFPSGVTAYVYNNTVYGTHTGFAASGGSQILKNNIVQGATDGYQIGDGGSTKNVSDIASDAPGTNPITGTVTFVSTSSGSEDLHLSPLDSVAKNAGADLSADAGLAFSTDIDGNTRPQSSTWDVGADEVYTDVTGPVISSVASTTEPTTATITWTTDELASSTVRYGTSVSYDSASSSSSYVTDHSITLTGLTPGTTYHFRVESGDSSYNYSTSSDYTFATEPPDTTAPVISAIATSTTGTTATITWTTDELATSSIAYGLTASYGSASSSASLATSHSITLTGLSTSTTYHLQITSTDSSYNSGTSADIVITTTEIAGTTYYVDYASGSNANSGRSTSAAWKHAPGDANATGTPASTTLVPGDAVYFKGGVRYKGAISMPVSGTASLPIIYDGDNGWGTGKAIIDGSVTATWTQCPNAAACGDNANYANIYYATLPSNHTWITPVYDSDSWLYHEIDVALTDPFIYTTTDDWHAISSGVSSTTITDAAVFTSASSTFYVGAYIQTQTEGNTYETSKINSFNPATDSVTFTMLSKEPMVDTQWDNKYHYSVVNNWRTIDEAGYYAIDEANSKIYAWPRTSSSNLTIGTLEYGFDTNGKSYVTIDGFKIQGQYNRVYATGVAIRGNNGIPTNGIIIQNNDIRNQTTSGGASANVYLLGNGTTTQYYRNNTMAYAYGRGILAQGAKNYTQNNTFDRSTGTVIFYFSAANNPAVDGVISDNTITNSGGLHANGITIYGTAVGQDAYIAERHVVKNNKIYNFGTRAGPFAVSQQVSYNIEFYNNLFEGQVIDDGPATGCTYMRYYNNVMIDGLNAAKGMRVISPQNCSEFKVIGNIIDGFLGASNQWVSIDHRYNIYLSLAFNQASGYGWTDGDGETTASTSTLAAVFNNAAADDFTLKSGGPAINALPTASAPTSIFTVDIEGRSRPQGSAWDLGPFEFAEADTTAPSITSVASTTTTTTATITWSTNESATSTVEYGATASYGTASSSSSFVTSHSITLSSLTPATTYHFRVSSGDASYNRATSSDYTFTTASSASAPTVTSSAASSLDRTSVTLNGSISSTGGENATARGFAYGTSNTLSSVIATTSSSGSYSTGSFSESVSSLTCETTYYFRPYASNSAGTAYGSITSFTTSACATSGGGSSSGARAMRQATSVNATVPPSLSSFIELLISLGVIPQDKIVLARASIAAPAPTFIRDLKLNDMGDDVAALQRFLNERGFTIAKEGPGSPGNETQKFGAATFAALKRYQAFVGLPSTGYFGPLTRAMVGK